MKSILSKIIVLLFISTSAFAIEGGDDSDTWNWGAKPVDTKGQWNALSLSVDMKAYSEGVGAASWLLANAPDLNVALYIKAVKVYEARVKAEKDPVAKRALQDSVLAIYDARIEHFGEEAEVLNRKGRVAWAYLYSRKGMMPELHSMYTKIYDLNGVNTLGTNCTSLMKATCRMHKMKKVSRDEVLALYFSLNETLDARIASTTTASKIKLLEKNKGKIDKELNRFVELDCDFVTSTYGPKYEATPDLKLAKKINSLMLSNKCVSNDLFISTSELIMTEEPSVERCDLMFKIYKNQKDLDQALIIAEKAIELAEGAEAKAEYLYEMAVIKSQQGKVGEARSLAYKSLEQNASLSKSYILVGDLYTNSYSTCEGEDVLVNRSVYIAAYNMYKKGGATTQMANAKAQFPSMEEIFVRGKQIGDEINTGCWISETVKLDKRD